MAAFLMAMSCVFKKFMDKIKREYVYFIFIILIIICIFQYGIQKICGFTMYPDEFGYWASAARVVGYNWNEVASLGSYYSFGYSIILIPLLKIFTNGVAAYRAAIAVNMLLMCISVFLLWNIIHNLFPETDKAKCAMISGAAVFYPSWIFYMQMTLTEAFLMFLFLAIVCLFVGFIKEPGIGKAAILAVGLIYMYSVHMRTIGVVIACLLTLLLWGLSNPAMRKKLLLLLVVIAVAAVIVAVVKKNVIMTVFTKADTATLSVNDYASQMQKIRHIFSWEGVLIFAKEIVAKIFYLGIASFGFFYWAMLWCIERTVRLVKKLIRKKKSVYTIQQWIAMFLILAVVGEVLICSIYMHGSKKIDCLVYGRYNEFLMPVLMAIGIVRMLKSQWIVLITLVMGAFSGIMLLPIFSVIESEKMEGIRGYFVVGLSYLLKDDKFDPYCFFRDAWLFGLALMILVAVIVWIVRKWDNTTWLLGIIVVIEILLGIRVSTCYTYKVNQAGFQDLIITEKIIENIDGNEKVIYFDEGAPEFIDFHQMQMPEIPIQVIKGEEMEKEELGDFVLVYRDSKLKDELGRIYDRYIVSNTCILYFNQVD